MLPIALASVDEALEALGGIENNLAVPPDAFTEGISNRLACEVPCVLSRAITDRFFACRVFTEYTPMSELPLWATSLKMTALGAEDSAGVKSTPPM